MKLDKLKLLQESGVTCPICALCASKQVYGIRIIDRKTLTSYFECEECILKEAREIRKLEQEKAARVAALHAQGKYLPKAEEDKFMDEEKWEKFKRCIYEKIYDALWTVLWATGARLGEALNLTLSDFKEAEVTITSLKRKDRLQMTYPLPRWIKAYLHAKNPDLEAPAFVNDQGKRITHRMAEQKFKTVCKRAGLSSRLSPHCLRHFFGMRAWESTRDMEAVKKLMRHTQISNTEKYMHLSEKKRLEISKKLIQQTESFGEDSE